MIKQFEDVDIFLSQFLEVSNEEEIHQELSNEELASEGNSENFKDQRDPKTRDHQNFHRYLFVCYFAGNGDDSKLPI